MHPHSSDRSFAELRLGDFIEEQSWLQFDVEELLLSLKYCDALNERMSDFHSALQACSGAWPARDRINAFIRNGGLSEIPAYRGMSAARSLDELPTTTKHDIRSFPDRFMNSRLTSELLWKKLTTGSSGPPLLIWYSSVFYYELLFLAPRKILARAAESSLRFNRLFCVSISDNQSMPAMAFVDPSLQAGLSIQAVVNGSKPETFDRMLDLVERHKPICIASKPSLLEVMARHLEQSSRELPRESVIISSGSALTSELRARLSVIAKGGVIDAYALTEFGLVASECRHQQLHIDVSSVFVEVLDEAGRELPPGAVGELVLSSDRNAVMPLMRYRTGDLGSIVFEECRCGVQSPRIRKLDGRMIQCFKLQNGELFPPTCFNDMFKRFPELQEFQMTELDVGVFQVDVELIPGTTEFGNILLRVQSHVQETLPGSQSVQIRRVSFGSDSKFQRYRSNL